MPCAPDSLSHDIIIESREIAGALLKFQKEHSLPNENLGDCISRLLKSYHPDKQHSGMKNPSSLNIRDVIGIRKRYKRLHAIGYGHLIRRNSLSDTQHQKGNVRMYQMGSGHAAASTAFSVKPQSSCQVSSHLPMQTPHALSKHVMWVWNTWWYFILLLVRIIANCLSGCNLETQAPSFLYDSSK